MGGHWERHASEWIDWTRTPGHDAFWFYLDAFRTFLPPAGRATLEIGCGEGRISRELAALGHTVTATDSAPSLLDAARAAESADEYRLTDAAALPFTNDEFDRVVAYNMLMDVPDAGAVLREAARVLEPDGLLVLSVVHPLADRGSFEGSEVDAPFVISRSWFDGGHFADVESRDGLTMHYDGWSRSLSEYITAIADAGLAITAFHEPRPDTNAPARLVRWGRMPLFLWITARRIPTR
jgi:2-polyprenyl-3-methyl-5-hydroxy-6-metoxy-1,4-benzoquinol methylase